MLTPKRLAAALRDMPPSTTAPTTRSRRSSESAISAASFARRQSSSRSKAIRESLPRFNSLGDRSNDYELGESGYNESSGFLEFFVASQYNPDDQGGKRCGGGCG